MASSENRSSRPATSSRWSCWANVYVVAAPTTIETALSAREAVAKLDGFQVAFGDALLAVEGDQWRRQRHAMEGGRHFARLELQVVPEMTTQPADPVVARVTPRPAAPAVDGASDD